jgi:glycosyltransferase involved in cell wall biosynthesis
VRILLVTPYHAPAYAFGGPVRMAEVMVTDLLAAGHAVTVATTDVLDERSRAPASAPALPAGAEVLRFRNVSHRLAARAMGWTPRGYVRWVRANAARYDLVVLHDVYSVLSVAAARAAVRAGVPYAVQPMGSVAAYAERGKPLLKRAFLRLWGRRTLREASALIHSTRHERGDLLAEGAREETLVDLPLPLDLPPRRGAAAAARPTLVHVGRLDPINGIDRLIRAVALARAAVPALALEVVGPGARHRRELEALARELALGDSVSFRGFVEAEEKVRTLERAHAMCLLSRSEGLPTAALEAMACGTPVILSRGCHLDEVDGVAGVVVSGEPAETAAAIVALLADAPRRAQLAQGAEAFAARFARERVTPRMIALFERLGGTA